MNFAVYGESGSSRFQWGRAKKLSVKGDHPVLVEAAVNLVREWKWEPAGHQSTEPIEVKFMSNLIPSQSLVSSHLFPPRRLVPSFD
jgi:hypothetical protein